MTEPMQTAQIWSSSASRPRRVAVLGCFLAALLTLCGHLPARAQLAQIQSIPLYTGWNLISFQVNPLGFTPQDITQALGNDSNALLAIWGYSAASKTWQAYQPASTLPPA